MTEGVQPPISAAAAAPSIEKREDVKTHRIESIKKARDRLQDVRIASQRRQYGPGYTTVRANTDYLIALQSLLVELEPLYNRLEVCQEYWTGVGKPIVRIHSPELSVEDVVDVPPARSLSGPPKLKNPGVLQRQHLQTIASLRDLLDLEAARIPYTVKPIPKDSRIEAEPHHGFEPVPRSALDQAMRWSVEFMEQIGLTVSDDNGGKPGRAGMESHYGDE